MKTIHRYIVCVLLLLGVTSCNYLDIVPDEKEKAEDAFKDQSAAERYLYSCYGYLPQPNSGSASLDFMTGDEVITSFEHEAFAQFPKGNYTASNYGISYWNTFFQGLRQCYILLNNVDKVPNLPEEVKKDYIAQTKFLIAYYHFLLSQCYGPIILIKEETDFLMDPSGYLARTPYDECVTYICNLFDEAARDLPSERTVRYYGLATNVAAKALKAKMLLFAASPLFNGNSEFYHDFTNKDGQPLMPLTYDPQKWVNAKKAYEEAIALAKESGYELYSSTNVSNGNTEPTDPTLHCLRYNIIDAGNKEIIWADTRGEGYYGVQNKSLPYSSKSAWNGVAPTLTMLKRFYTKNGLPIDKDPSFNTTTMFDVTTIGSEYADVAEVGAKTLRFNLEREPRFYSWIAFQGGFYEIMNADVQGAYVNDASYKKYSGKGKGKLVCDFVLGGNCSRGNVGSLRQTAYSPTGYLNKKGVDPNYQVSANMTTPLEYPWPIVRMADLYLGYAEACVESNDLSTAKTYLNHIRQRAGIPTVEKSWEEIAHLTLDQNLLRDIVRQERQIELYLENQNFWDMRRWKLAGGFFNVKAQGMNIDGASIDEFATIKTVVFERKFESPTQYLLPIPLEDVNRNSKLVQNPGYN